MKRPSLRQQIEILVDHWKPILGLEGWAIELRFDETVLAGYCKAKPRYLTAVIGFNLDRVRKEYRTPQAVEELTVHELVHCIIWKSSERAVSQVTYSLLRAAGRRSLQ